MGCFVFFKQKTAYEMRISDWSSDVCSSDLGGCHLFAGGRLLAQEYAFQFRACLVDEIRRQHYSFVGVDKDTRLHLPSPAGIGRAVEDGAVSVAAIGLKKSE